MKDIKLAVVGSRTFTDFSTLLFTLNKIKKENNFNYVEIVSGGAKGADELSERYASINKILTKIFYADWKNLGKRAGYIRNVDIITRADACVAFWDGESHGTKHDIELCREQKKICFIYNFKTNTLDVELNGNTLTTDE